MNDEELIIWTEVLLNRNKSISIVELNCEYNFEKNYIYFLFLFYL